MLELFRTVLVLSLLGFGMTAVLLLLKPVTAKRLPAKWQYYTWVAVLLVMLVPVYKLIPRSEAQRLPIFSQPAAEERQAGTAAQGPDMVVIEGAPFEYREIPIGAERRIRQPELMAYIWLFGAVLFLTVVTASYIVYLRRRRKSAVLLDGFALFEDVKRELNVKRCIKIRMSPDVSSPLLVGVFLPVVYIPCREIPDENMRMVLLHELTHYRRKDLLIKWLSIFVNAVHWFNPLAYLLCANVGQACEVSCDMEVTKSMSDAEQKLYMKTILDLAE